MFCSLQIGNAVPPPMGRAIGQEIKKCLVWKEKQPKKETDSAEDGDEKQEGEEVNGEVDGKDVKRSSECDQQLKIDCSSPQTGGSSTSGS